MVKLAFVIHILGLLLLVGCYNGNNLEVIDGGNCIVVSTATSRTSLGEKNNGAYPVYWSASDKIAVNGAESQSTAINAENPTIAKFSFDATLQYPYNITYPYTSTTTADAPMVEFLAEQSYVSGSFCEGSAPMCGYVSQKDEKVELKHLAGVLRFAVKGGEENIVLDKVVVTSKTAKLAGEFSVDCTNGTIAPGENAGNSVTYALPSNFKLSTEEHSYFYIAVPAVEVGECTVDFVEPSGEKMRCVWSSSKPVTAGKVREFASVTYKGGAAGVLSPLEAEQDNFETANAAYGYVKDSNGNPIAGVAVSDGFTVTATNSRGFYSLQTTSDTWYIYVSVPSEYEIPRGEYGLPTFYKKFEPGNQRYDFTLTPLSGGKEEKFALFTITDVHLTSQTKLETFRDKVVPHINKQYDAYAKEGISAYCVNLGDNITNYDQHNTSDWRDDILSELELSKTPIFSVFGNHDCCYFDATQPLCIDERSSTYDLKAQREFEDMFGPINYSFNRGDVHIVCMRDILFVNPNLCEINRGFTAEQYEWVKQDLALVSKEKMVVLCVHHQLYNSDSPYCQEILSIMDDFKEGHIMSGHGHVQRNSRYGNHNDIYEHVTCSICGPVWTFDLCGDGTPCGYQIFLADGAHFADWYYISYLEGLDSRDHQFRLYRGNARTGAAISGTNKNGTKGYYQFNFGENTILANIYNADSRWKVSVYEDGVYSGDMERLPGAKPAYSELVGDGSYESPFRFADGVVSGYDFYVGGYHLGLKGRQTSYSGAWTQCVHMYKYDLKNKDAKVEVVVKDFFGKVYTKKEFIDCTDYSSPLN